MKNKTLLIVTAIIAIVVVFSVGYWWGSSQTAGRGQNLPIIPIVPADPAGNDNQVACTMEAKICPDGSGVGRVGPNCEFAPCP